MDFIWDRAKNQANLLKHNFSFEEATLAWDDPNAFTYKDERTEYGEDRFNILATVDATIFNIAFTIRGDSIRIISARRANRKERKRYEEKV